MNTPEFDLLLSLARTVPDAERAHAIVNAGVDWQALLDLAARHRVRPLIYRSLLNVCWDRVPSDIQAEWEEADRAITGRNRFVTGELLRLAAAFRLAEVPLVALKGPTLAEMAYGDFALREFSDLDLLVRVADFKTVTGLLKELGYTPDLNIDGGEALQFLWPHGELTFGNNLEGPDVDLHWRVATQHTGLLLEADYFWPRFRPVRVAGEEMLSFSPQDLTLYLASEAGKDGWIELRRLCDVSAFLRRSEALDWAQLIEEARRLRGMRTLLLALKLARDLLGAELPQDVAKRIRDDEALPRLAAKAVRRLACRDAPGLVKQFVFEIEAKERWHRMAAVVFGRLTLRTKSDAEWIALPKHLWWLYRVVRPVRLLCKLGRAGD